jgi:hypothetical protein
MPAAEMDTRPERRLVSGQDAASGKDRTGHMAVGKVLQMADRAHPMPSPQKSVSEITSLDPGPVQPAQKKISKNWLQRLLSTDPPDPRKTQREALTWISAYFFTGGRPLAHGVRDISVTGLYVLTEERWYMGTIIRITLTDQRQPVAERSCTVNARVVRWGNDGVGLQFVLTDTKDRRRENQVTGDGQVHCVSKVQVEQFLQRIRSGATS